MRLLGKKKKKEEGGEVREEPVKKRRRRRKKKEKPKPWGRRERILVLLLVVFTTGISTILALSARAWKLPGLPKMNTPTWSLPGFSEEKIIIELEEEGRQKADRIIENFESSTNELSGVYGLYVVDLQTGFSFGVNELEEFEPASLNKLPVMTALYKEAELGNLSLDEEYELQNSDKLRGSGSLASEPEGTILTYRDLVRYMGKESDNTAVNITKKILGREKIDMIVEHSGMDRSVMLGDGQKTTPEDIGKFFVALVNGELTSDEHKDELLSFLTDTIYEQHLAAGIPSGVQVAHKYGREVHVVNDAGLVMGDKPYVVVILTKGVVEREADEVFLALSRIVYEGMTAGN